VRREQLAFRHQSDVGLLELCVVLFDTAIAAYLDDFSQMQGIFEQNLTHAASILENDGTAPPRRVLLLREKLLFTLDGPVVVQFAGAIAGPVSTKAIDTVVEGMLNMLDI